MKASDTVLTEDEIVAEASKDCTYCQLSVDIGCWVAKKQAEISFKAGIKEVVKWIKTNQSCDITPVTFNRKSVEPCVLIKEKDWLLKLKEWGVE